MSVLSRLLSAVRDMLGALTSQLTSGAPAGGRVGRLTLAALALVAGAMSLGVSPASAETTHVFSSTFGSSGSAAGELSGPTDVAVSSVGSSAGDVYVADPGNDRIDEFDSSGNFVRAWGWGVADGASSFETCTSTCQAGISGSGAGEFETPTFVAVDNSTGASAGDVYVGDTGDNLITKFTASGAVVSSWGDSVTPNGQLSGTNATGGPFSSLAGITVDGAGDLFAYDPNNDNWFEFSQAGVADPTVTVGRGTQAVGIGVDSGDDFYKVVGNGNVEQYSSAGTDLGDVTDDQTGSITGFAIDPTTNDFYADDGGGLIRHYDASSLSACVPAGDCAAADTFGAANLSGSAAGVAFNAANGNVYAADSGGNDVAVFAPAIVPDATTGSASNLEPFSASVAGNVDPAGGGNVTGCEFEYVDNADYRASAADPYRAGQTVSCSPSTPYSAATAVSADITGLTPDTTYHFRVDASNASGGGDGSDQTFTTTQAAVTGAASVTSSGATLNGIANAGGTTVSSCQFEYVDAAGYDPNNPDPYSTGQTAACTPTPSGLSAEPVSAQITGLTAGTVYHYRLEFTNAGGTWTGGDQSLFIAGTPAGPAPTAGTRGLPDGRVYEQVSPVNKNGNTAGATPEGGVNGTVPDYTLTTADGSAVVSGALDVAQKDFGTNSYGTQFFQVYRRSATGWSANGLLPPENGQPDELGNTTRIQGLGLSSDFSEVALGALRSFGSAPANAVDLVEPAGSVNWLSKPTIADPFVPVPASATPWVVGGSPDLNPVYFGYYGTLVPSDDASDAAFGGASRSSVLQTVNQNVGLYEWTPSAGLTYAGVLPDGSENPYGALPASYGSHFLLPASDGEPIDNSPNPVSSDGADLFFVSPDPQSGAPASDPVELYVHETAADGSQHTVLISKSAVSGQPAADSPVAMNLPHGGGHPDSYMYASPDGSHVLFEDVDALTSDAPNDGSLKAYVFDTSAGTLSYLPGVADQPDAGQSPNYCPQDGCQSPVLVSSTNGSTFLFMKETAGGESLELWSGGAVTPIAQFPGGCTTPSAVGPQSVPCLVPDARASADGSAFVFETDSPIYTTAPGEFNNDGGYEQIYRYVTATGELSCLSCGPAGLAHTGDAVMSNDATQGGPAQGVTFLTADSRGISADGERVFFDSPDPLVPQAANGQRNVYEWEAAGVGSCPSATAGGCLYLISSGQSSSSDFFLDNSASGNDVFFATAQGLVAQDTTQDYDIYDARVGGGFPSQSGPAPCDGDACQGPPSTAPTLPDAGTVTFTGPGNQRSVSARARVREIRKTLRGSRFLITVSVPVAGKLRVSGAGIETGYARVRRAGTFKLTVRLTKKGARLARKRHRLRVRVVVRYLPVGGSSSVARLAMTVKA